VPSRSTNKEKNSLKSLKKRDIISDETRRGPGPAPSAGSPSVKRKVAEEKEVQVVGAKQKEARYRGET